MNKLINKPRYQIKLERFKDGGVLKSPELDLRKGRYTDSSVFARDLYRGFYKAMRKRGHNVMLSKNLALWKTALAALESHWGDHPLADYSYGGMNGGKTGHGVAFTSLDDYINGWIANSDDRWEGWDNATSFLDYMWRLSLGLLYGGEPFEKYYPRFKGMELSVIKRLGNIDLLDIEKELNLTKLSTLPQTILTSSKTTENTLDRYNIFNTISLFGQSPWDGNNIKL